jgi:CRISPR-associated protein Cas2
MPSIKHFVVVAYDIPDDKRRGRLHHTLEGFGTPVQYSVFECLLEDKDVVRMKRAVTRTISKRKDHVRYYHLCAACQKHIETSRGPEPAHEQPTLIV